jgi:hypothetical protein
VIIAVLVILVLVAVSAWFMAVVSAIAIVQLAPPGEKFASLFRLGWLRFPTLSAQLGPAALPHLARYRAALFTFLACIIAAVAMSMLLATEQLN